MQIGNAVINQETDSIGMIDYWASHALISLESSRKIHKYCNFSLDAQRSDECNSALDEAGNMVGDIDIYNIDYPLCFDGNVTSIPKRFSVSVPVFLVLAHPIVHLTLFIGTYDTFFGSDSRIVYNTIR